VVKKITYEQSRRNSARRRHRVQSRHRQAGHWGERGEPMLTSQKISYEIGGNVEATPFGGLFAMHRLATRPTLTISDEYDVQDLLRAVLSIFFEDVREESWTPSYAGGASRIDFLIPAFELAIEVKKARASMTAKSLADELIVDRDRYKAEQRAKHLICLVFDYEGILAGPRGLEADLAREATVEGLAVKVKIFDR
jgi:hypothetical protein